MKICTKCGEENDESEYYEYKGGRRGLHAQCKACYRKYNREYIKSDRYIRSLKFAKEIIPMIDRAKRGCLLCDITDPRLTCHHHRDPPTKLFEVSQAQNLRRSIGEVFAEMEKCEVLCLHCHVLHHAGEPGYEIPV